MNKQEFLARFMHARTVKYESDYPLPNPGKPAAVLLPIVERKDELSMLFTLRAKHLKHHAGQVSFPGGKQEEEDVNLLATALRETQEEIGLNPNTIEIIGELPRYRTISRYEVLPFIGFVSAPISLSLDENEVHSVFEVPLSYLLDQNNHLVHWVDRKQQHQTRRFPIYFIPYQGINIWGATAAFVRNLSHHV